MSHRHVFENVLFKSTKNIYLYQFLDTSCYKSMLFRKKNIFQYGVDDAVTAKWDDLQEDMHCCGGNNFLLGYNDYRSTPIGVNNSVPDSCCHKISKGCGKDILNEVMQKNKSDHFHELIGNIHIFQNPENIRNTIFVDGCLTILRTKLENDVIPMMIVYAVVGVVLALTELITVVLACAYVAQITRRMG